MSVRPACFAGLLLQLLPIPPGSNSDVRSSGPSPLAPPFPPSSPEVIPVTCPHLWHQYMRSPGVRTEAVSFLFSTRSAQKWCEPSEVTGTWEAEGIPGGRAQGRSEKERDRFSPAGHQAVFLEKEKMRMEIKQRGRTLGSSNGKADHQGRAVRKIRKAKARDSRPLLDDNFYVNRKRCPSLSQRHIAT